MPYIPAKKERKIRKISDDFYFTNIAVNRLYNRLLCGNLSKAKPW